MYGKQIQRLLKTMHRVDKSIFKLTFYDFEKYSTKHNKRKLNVINCDFARRIRHENRNKILGMCEVYVKRT